MGRRSDIGNRLGFRHVGFVPGSRDSSPVVGRAVSTRHPCIVIVDGAWIDCSHTGLTCKPQPDGSPYAEHVDGKYFYVVSERGAEFERRETDDPIEGKAAAIL